MATSRRGIRSTRKLRQWIIDQVESGKFPGLVWDDPDTKTMIRIPWKHAGKQEFRQDEDAGFFKAWAIFKGKYKPGEPATWKTRVRCALAKSSEFEEVRERSRLGTAEPYKVYRLVPVPEQSLGKQSKAQKLRNSKVESSSESSENENSIALIVYPEMLDSLSTLQLELNGAQEITDSHIPNPVSSSAYQNVDATSPLEELEAPNVNATAVQMSPGPVQGMLCDDPKAEAPNVNATAVQMSPGPVQGMLCDDPKAGDFSVNISIFYCGEKVHFLCVPEGEFLITPIATPPRILGNSMNRVVLPPPLKMEDPQKREVTQQLLQDFEKGIMAASNVEGIFVQCRGKASVFWRGPTISQPHGKLQSNTHTRLFNTRGFKAALENYYLGLGPRPEHCVTLCVGEELGGNDSLESKHIIIQMEQKYPLSLIEQQAGLIPISSVSS